VSEAPAEVIKLALKATQPIGDGLYGVDLKQVGDKPVVIEVNDNPSIDAGVEDAHLGEPVPAHHAGVPAPHGTQAAGHRRLTFNARSCGAHA
jgi:hypothetical protein